MENSTNFKCNGIFITNLDFSRKKQLSNNPTYEININIAPAINLEKKIIETGVTVNVNNMEKTIKASCTALGLFSFPESLGELKPEGFANVNAAAIIYPFCREAIASVSVKAGIQPILLPPFDFAGAYMKGKGN